MVSWTWGVSFPSGFGLVVEDVHRAIAHLQEVNMAGELASPRTGRVLIQENATAVLLLKQGDFFLRKPNRNLDCNR